MQIIIDKDGVDFSVLKYTGLFKYLQDIIVTENDTEYVIDYSENGEELCNSIEEHQELAGDYSQELIATMMDNASSEAETWLDEYLDQVAKDLGWGSASMSPMLSARASAKPILDSDSEYTKKVKAEANSLELYYFAVWEIAMNIKNEILAGERLLPTKDEMIAMLPTFNQ